jgi:hypothetical protein
LSNSLFKGFLSKIKRTPRLFDGPALDRMAVYHRCSHITMVKQFLDGSDIVIGLQQIGGKAVTKGSPQTQIPVDGGYLSCWLYRSSYHPIPHDIRKVIL